METNLLAPNLAVFFSPEMVADAASFSPSAAKPAQVREGFGEPFPALPGLSNVVEEAPVSSEYRQKQGQVSEIMVEAPGIKKSSGDIGLALSHDVSSTNAGDLSESEIGARDPTSVSIGLEPVDCSIVVSGVQQAIRDLDAGRTAAARDELAQLLAILGDEVS